MQPLLADGIAPEGLLLVGLVFFVIPAAAVVGMEALVLSLVARLGFRRALRWSLWANLVSALAGIPLLWMFSANFERMVASDLHLYFAGYLRFALIRYVTYFGVTAILESLVAYRLNKKLISPIASGRLIAAVIVANVLSYAVISPIHYWATRPTHTLARLTADTAWSHDSATPIFFIDPTTHHLCRTTPMGSPVETLAPYPMSGYQLSPDLMTCLFVQDGVLSCYRCDGSAPPVRIAVLPEARRDIPLMATVTLSPSCKRVAYTQRVRGQDSRPDAYDLCIFDMVTGQTITMPSVFAMPDPPLLAWTRDEAVLVASVDEYPDAVRQQIRLVGNSAQVTDLPSRSTLGLCPNYGTFGTGMRPSNQMTGSDALPSANLYATAWYALYSQYVTITRNKPWPENTPADKIISIDDNPGIRVLSFHRQYCDVAILPSSLVLLADETFATLYLMDPQTRTLGKLVRGQAPIVLTPKYQMAAHLFAADPTTRR